MLDAMDKIEKYIEAQGQVSETDSRLLREIAYERIQEAIKYTHLQPGDPLSETRLSRALGISRTPIREALQRLAREGLLQIIPGRAITVAAPSMQEVLDAIHVRELLEPELVRLAADGLPSEAREILLQAIHEMEEAAQAGDRASWRKADTIWHETLSHYCPNRLLGQLVLQARNRMFNEGAAEKVPDQYISEGTVEHRAVVDAIMANDGDTAEQLMKEHIRQVRENMFKRLVRY